jgi:hypothetical protein
MLVDNLYNPLKVFIKLIHVHVQGDKWLRVVLICRLHLNYVFLFTQLIDLSDLKTVPPLLAWSSYWTVECA